MTESWKPSRRCVLKGGAAAAVLGGLAATPLRSALADTFPSRTINVIVPTREGGGADRILRAFAAAWQKDLKAKFEPTFMPAASGRVGYETFMTKRDADGHSLLFGNMGPEVLNWVVQPPTFKFPGAYVYFCQVDVDPSVVYVSRKSRFRTMEDIVAEAKKRTLPVATSRLAHPASIGILALGEAIGARFNLIPFSGGKNTLAAVSTGETDLGVLPSGTVASASDVVKTVLMFDDENAIPKVTDDAPVVNKVFGTRIPPLFSSRAFAIQQAAIDKHPDRFKILNETAVKVFKDPDFKAAYEKTGAVWENIKYGSLDACNTYVRNIVALGEKYKPLITGKPKKT